MKKNISNNHLYNGSPLKVAVYLKLFILCCLVFAVSCKSKKQLIVKRVAADSVATKPTDTKLVKLAAIRAGQVGFKTFSGKARTKLDINGNSNDVTLNIRIQRNKKIWVSVTAIAGIEVARALITPDSILLINRLQSLYLRKPFSYVYKFAGNQVNYKTLESLMVGNIIPELINDNTTYTPGTGSITLSGTLNGLLFKLLLGPDLRVTQTNLNNQSAAQTLTVTNSVFIRATNKVIPSQVDMASTVKTQKIQVNLHYIKADFDQPLEFPFSIPSRYDPAQ